MEGKHIGMGETKLQNGAGEGILLTKSLKRLTFEFLYLRDRGSKIQGYTH